MRLTGRLSRFYRNNRKLILTAIFAFAMGILEAVVVVYLRKMYYPEGFDFPLKTFSLNILSIEVIREAATLIMLWTVALLAAKKWHIKFAYFFFLFGVWDISYYIGLKCFLNWPLSFLTWDLLFLIPLPWISPVIAPILVALTMIIYAVVVIDLEKRGFPVFFRLKEIIIMLAGGILIFISFVWNYTKIIFENSLLTKFLSIAKTDAFQVVIERYKPVNFKWGLYMAGLVLIYISLALFVRNSISKMGR
ncbi:MAG: hypothetical protein KGY74_10155 [Candidatus Cloacimonetes bacterium]|nr:hypothetical protein [Candidatus Cloacimonadota bacterium]